jgi:hypothetical protein
MRSRRLDFEAHLKYARGRQGKRSFEIETETETASAKATQSQTRLAGDR